MKEAIFRRRFAGTEESSVHIDRSFNLAIESAGPRSLGLGFHRLFLLSLSTGTSAVVVYSRPSRLSSFSGWKPSPPPSPTDTLLAKTGPLSEAEEIVKNKLLAQYF
ncbi:hypothetical protein IGI04_008373 [Brassica rapa subsp. trilocularis]|uniref:Uncharacterized protein n=1 Tax=Brassica rapa subsp. trilocularis TaxID=1813537 RepID=A0ABQ7NMG3_BRACM|nr:hypothetical protein IGI04_008373 [Brassica rapa subsp. trilocularis]